MFKFNFVVWSLLVVMAFAALALGFFELHTYVDVGVVGEQLTALNRYISVGLGMPDHTGLRLLAFMLLTFGVVLLLIAQSVHNQHEQLRQERLQFAAEVRCKRELLPAQV